MGCDTQEEVLRQGWMFGGWLSLAAALTEMLCLLLVDYSVFIALNQSRTSLIYLVVVRKRSNSCFGS